MKKPNLTDLDKEALKRVLPEFKWIACDENGVVYAHAHMPLRDEELGVWYEHEDASLFLINKDIVQRLFQWCKWEGEPWYIPDLLE